MKKDTKTQLKIDQEQWLKRVDKEVKNKKVKERLKNTVLVDIDSSDTTGDTSIDYYTRTHTAI